MARRPTEAVVVGVEQETLAESEGPTGEDWPGERIEARGGVCGGEVQAHPHVPPVELADLIGGACEVGIGQVRAAAYLRPIAGCVKEGESSLGGSWPIADGGSPTRFGDCVRDCPTSLDRGIGPGHHPGEGGHSEQRGSAQRGIPVARVQVSPPGAMR